jgi:hypothetical protein
VERVLEVSSQIAAMFEFGGLVGVVTPCAETLHAPVAPFDRTRRQDQGRENLHHPTAVPLAEATTAFVCLQLRAA